MIRQTDANNQQLYLVLILWGTAVLNLFGLVHLSPPGPAHDEVANWLIDQSILAGNHAVYFTRAYGHEAGFHYVQTAFVALLGDNLLALRLPAAFSGLLGVAVSYALVKLMFGKRVAFIAAALLGTLFWPVFYSRLALRAISLPLVSGLSAYFWWRGEILTQRIKEAKAQRKEKNLTQRRRGAEGGKRVYVWFGLAGMFAGLTLYTYMAARAVPIFYGLYVVYLWLFQREEFKQQWRAVLWFTAVFILVAAPITTFLLTNSGAEFRIAEVSAPLDALRQGNLQPVLSNLLKIVAGFGFVGDPLWRQNVAVQPVFDPILAALFYVGVVVFLWRWRNGRYAFVLLWLTASTVPSIVTINAPSTIRMINALPLLMATPAVVMHKIHNLSTINANLSTVGFKIWGLLVLTLILINGIRTTYFTFGVWPTGGDIPFVWQTALTETAVYLDTLPVAPAAVAGWSPDTMDPNTMALMMQDDTRPLSHFNPEEGTLLVGTAVGPSPQRILRPTILELNPHWEQQLKQWNAAVTLHDSFVEYTLPSPPQINPQYQANILFGSQFRLLGYDVSDQLITYWQVEADPRQAARMFVQFLDSEGNVVAEEYRLDNLDPQELWFPHWQVGDLILQIHAVPLDKSIKSMRIGFFDPYSCTPEPCQNLHTTTGDPFAFLSLHR
jgi:4-amino-4-deoxy-L-arabinose transferase-like glycosyltransferase